MGQSQLGVSQQSFIHSYVTPSLLDPPASPEGCEPERRRRRRRDRADIHKKDAFFYWILRRSRRSHLVSTDGCIWAIIRRGVGRLCWDTETCVDE